MLASNALAVVGPMPGSFISRLLRSLAAFVVARGLGDGAVVFGNAFIQPVGMGKQISYAAVGVARQVFQVCADLAAQAGDFLRQRDAELGDQAAQAVVACGAFLDESLPGAVQTQDDLLVFFLDRDEKHGRSGDGLADRGGIRRIVLAATASHAIGRDELRRHQFDGVAVLPEQPRPVVRAGAGFHADQARRQLRDQRQQVSA